MLGWLRALPDELIASRPVLSVHYAGLLLDSGQLEGAEGRLRDAERWLDKIDRTGTARSARRQADRGGRAEFRRLPGAIAVYRAAQAHLRGDVAATRRTPTSARTHRSATTTWVVGPQRDSWPSRIGQR